MPTPHSQDTANIVPPASKVKPPTRILRFRQACEMVALSPRYYARLERAPFRRFKIEGRRGWYVAEEDVVAYIDRVREVQPSSEELLLERLSAQRKEVERRHGFAGLAT